MKLHPIARWLLWPFSLVYGAAVVVRAWLYRIGLLRQKRLNGIVISVGNLTVGGTGKTPFVMMLAQRLFDRGKRVGILSRGYKGRPRTDEGAAENPDAGSSVVLSDETWMMERHLQGIARIGVGAGRYAQGLRLEAEGIEWFILDDGYQHLQLARDVDILLIDSRDPFGHGQLLPSGRLREPKSAMARADLVVITRTDHAPALEAVVRQWSKAPIFYGQTELKQVYLEERSPGDPGTAAWLGKRVLVFCGIGNPAAFVENVGLWGMEVAGTMDFPDHHRYSLEDVQEIERRAAAAGAEAIVCTEKDTYNLGRARFHRLPLFVCRIGINLKEPEKFWESLYAIIDRKRGAEHRDPQA